MSASRLLKFLLLPILSLLAACGAGNTSGPSHTGTSDEVTLTVTLAQPTLSIGHTTAATVVATDQNGASVALSNVVWSSSNPSVATVNGAGIVTAVASGTATITAASGSLTGSAIVTVGQSPPSGPPLAVSLGAPAIAVGQSTTAVAEDVNGQPIDASLVKWTSSVPTIATVNSAGLVTGVSPGTSKISATYNGVTATTSILVQSP